MQQQRRFARFAWIVLAVTLGVIVWGAYVRATGSGAGCGSHWPTCNGEVIPRGRGAKTLIEFTHRATSGISFLLVVAQLVWAFRAFPKGSPVRRAAAASMFLMVTEAGVGAGLVLFEMVAQNKSIARAWWMAAHLVNTFLLVGSMTLTAWWASRGRAPRLSRQGLVGLATAAALLGTLILGTSGAVTALGDTLFPAATLTEGVLADLSPGAHFLVRLRVLHPIIGLSVGAYVLFAGGFIGSRRPRVRRLAWIVAALFGAQIALGFLNMTLLAPIPLQLLHLLFADAVWISLVILAAETLADTDPAADAVERTASEHAAPSQTG